MALTTTRAVRPAATTLTLPPAGRSRSASTASCLAAVRRSGATSVAAMLADVSMTRTMSRARPAGRSRNGRAASTARSRTSRSWRSSRRLRRSRCHGAFASTSATSRCHSRVDGTTVSSRRSLSRYIATTAGRNSEAEQGERGDEAHRRLPEHAAAAQLREHQVGQGDVGREWDVARPTLARRDRRSRTARPRGGSYSRRWSARSTVTSTPSPVSTSTSRRSPSSAGSSSLGREDVEDDQLRAGRREFPDHPIGSRVEQVGQEDDRPPAGSWAAA